MSRMPFILVLCVLYLSFRINALHVKGYLKKKPSIFYIKLHFQGIPFHTPRATNHNAQCFGIAFASAGARVKAGSLHVSDSAVARVINELNYLRSNHSDVMEAETDARSALDTAVNNHNKLKVQIDAKKAANINYQKQVEDLLGQKLSLQANLSAAGQPQSTRKQQLHREFQNKSTKNVPTFSPQRTLV